jgi:putative transcriptional regulator
VIRQHKKSSLIKLNKNLYAQKIHLLRDREIMNQALIDQIISALHKAGFVTSEVCDVRPRCFDVAARRASTLIFLKILTNIDGLSEDIANELKKLADYFSSSPLIVGEKARDHYLDRGAVYWRYGVPSINIETLFDFFVDGIPPLVYAAPGGLYVNIDGEVLFEARTQRNMSLGTLASQLGVTRRSISKYEEGMDAKVEIALKLEDILNVALAIPINILTRGMLDDDMRDIDSLPLIEKKALVILTDLGFDVFPMFRTPFDALTQEGSNTLLTGISKYSAIMIKRAKLMSSISHVIQTNSMFIVEGESKFKKVDDTIVIQFDELEEFGNAKELIGLIKERFLSC